MPRRYLEVSPSARAPLKTFPHCTALGPDGERRQGPVYWVASQEDLLSWGITEVRCRISPEVLADPAFHVPDAWTNWHLVEVEEMLPLSEEETLAQMGVLSEVTGRLDRQRAALQARQKPVQDLLLRRRVGLQKHLRFQIEQAITAELGLRFSTRNDAWIYKGHRIIFSQTQKGKCARFWRWVDGEDEVVFTPERATWTEVLADVQVSQDLGQSWVLQYLGKAVTLFGGDPREGGTPILGDVPPEVQQELVAGRVPPGYLLQAVKLNPSPAT